MKAEKILNYFNSNDIVTSEILQEMKDLTESDLEYILGYNGNISYILKCYITVLNIDVLRKLYMQNPTLVEDKFAKMWVEEVDKEPIVNLMDAYMPLKIFNNNFLRMVRRGIEKNYDEPVLYSYDNKIIKIIYAFRDVGYNKIGSNLLCIDTNDNDEEFFNKLKGQDFSLYQDVIKIKENILFFIKFLDYYYANEESDKKVFRGALKVELKNKDKMFLSEDVLPANIVEEVFKELSVKNNMDADVFSVSNHLKRESDEDTFEEPNFGDLEDIGNLKEDGLRGNLNKYKSKSVKKKNNLKIVLVCISLMFLSIVVATHIIKGEIEDKNKIRQSEKVDIEKSEIPIEVEYIKEDKNE